MQTHAFFNYFILFPVIKTGPSKHQQICQWTPLGGVPCWERDSGHVCGGPMLLQMARLWEETGSEVTLLLVIVRDERTPVLARLAALRQRRPSFVALPRPDDALPHVVCRMTGKKHRGPMSTFFFPSLTQWAPIARTLTDTDTRLRPRVSYIACNFL